MNMPTNYKHGRCQVADGIGCIRPQDCPAHKEKSGYNPDSGWCMFCEDDSYKWSDVPEDIWMSEEWKQASHSEKIKILDKYVEDNPQYDYNKFEPFYD